MRTRLTRNEKTQPTSMHKQSRRPERWRRAKQKTDRRGVLPSAAQSKIQGNKAEWQGRVRLTAATTMAKASIGKSEVAALVANKSTQPVTKQIKQRVKRR